MAKIFYGIFTDLLQLTATRLSKLATYDLLKSIFACINTSADFIRLPLVIPKKVKGHKQEQQARNGTESLSTVLFIIIITLSLLLEP